MEFITLNARSFYSVVYSGAPSLAPLHSFMREGQSLCLCSYTVVLRVKEKEEAAWEQLLTRSYPFLAGLRKRLNPIGPSIFPIEDHIDLIWVRDKDYSTFCQNYQSIIKNACCTREEAPPTGAAASEKPWLVRKTVESPVEEVVVVGAGIAGAVSAYRLANLGCHVKVIDAAAKLGEGASGNHQGIMYARIGPSLSSQTQLLYHAFPLATTLLNALDPEGAFSGRGLLQLAYNREETKRQQKLANYCFSIHQWLERQQVRCLLTLPLDESGLWWPEALWVDPVAWIKRLLHHPHIEYISSSPIDRLCYQEDQWVLYSKQHRWSAEAVVLALGDDFLGLYAQLGLNHLRWVSGQSSLLNEKAFRESIPFALSGEAYITPSYQGIHTIGATFHPNNHTKEEQIEDDLANLKAIQKLGIKVDETALKTGHRGVRLMSFDHLPLIGPVGRAIDMADLYNHLYYDRKYSFKTTCPFWPRLYINAAHGSRGLLTAPLGAWAIASDLTGGPDLLGRDLRAVLHPNRVIARSIAEGKFK